MSAAHCCRGSLQRTSVPCTEYAGCSGVYGPSHPPGGSWPPVVLPGKNCTNTIVTGTSSKSALSEKFNKVGRLRRGWHFLYSLTIRKTEMLSKSLYYECTNTTENHVLFLKRSHSILTSFSGYTTSPAPSSCTNKVDF